MSLTKCPRCEKYGNPRETTIEGGIMWRGPFPFKFLTCEFCGWKLPLRGAA